MDIRFGRVLVPKTFEALFCILGLLISSSRPLEIIIKERMKTGNRPNQDCKPTMPRGIGRDQRRRRGISYGMGVAFGVGTKDVCLFVTSSQ